MDNIAAHQLLNSSAVVVSGTATMLLHKDLPESLRDLLTKIASRAKEVDEALYKMVLEGV